MAQLTVDTGMNTKPVLNGIKDMSSAIRSLRGIVTRAGKDMDASVVGYARAMRNTIAASREAKAQIQELNRAYAVLIARIDEMAEDVYMTPQYAELNDELRKQEQYLKRLQSARKKDTTEIQNTQYEINALKSAMASMRNAGTAFQYGYETEEFERLSKQATEIINESNRIEKAAKQNLQLPYLKQWREMTTVTGTVANGLARVANAAMFAGHALIHPFETLNRLIPFVLSGLAQLAKKALDAAISFGKMAISRAATILRNIASAALNAAANLAKMAGSAVISFLRRLAEAARNAAAQIARVAGKAVVAGLKGIGSLASRAGKAILGIGKSAKRSNNSLGQAVKMLVRYGFGVRSIYMLVRRLRGALVDAFKNMAKQVPEVNKAISSLSASLGMLKNSMATAFQPILNAIAPILTQFMDMLSEAMTRVGMFFAALVGQDYVYKATKAQFDYAKSLDKTKKSAKEAENQLASFDELNILKAPNDSSSGTGTDTNLADGGKFIKTPLESGIKEFVETLKRMFKSGEFAELGELLASKINKFIGSIDWAGYAVKIGDLVNGLVKFYNAFMEDIGWRNIGTTIADVINGLVDTIDWEALGRAFSQRINAIFGILTGLIDQINEANLGQALSDALWGFFGNIHWVEIGTTIGEGLNKIAGAVTEFATNFPWEEFATEVANGANALFSQITPTKIGGMLVGIIHGGFKFLLKFLQIFSFEEHGKALQDGIKTFVEGIDADLIGETLKSAIIGVLSYITTALGDEQTWRVAGLKLAFALNRLFGTHQAGENVWTRLADAIVTAAKSVITSLTEFVSKFEWGQAGENFHQGVLKLIESFPTEELGHLLNIAIRGVLDGIAPTISDPKVWSNLGTRLGTFLNRLFGNRETWKKVGQTANNMLNGILTFGKDFLETFNEKTAADNIKAALDEIKWGEIATKLWDTAKLAFKKAGNFLDVLFGDFDIDKYNLVKGKLDYPEELANSVVDNSSLGTKIGNKIREALSKIPWKSIGEELWNNAKAIGTNIEDFIVSILGITPNEVNDAGGKIKAIGSKIGTTVGRALSQIPWKTILSDAKDFLLTALGNMFNELADPNNGNGPILLKAAAAIAGLKVGISLLFAGLKSTILGEVGKIGITIGLAIYDIKGIAKLAKIAGEFNDLIESDREDVRNNVQKYKEIAEKDGKVVADAYAAMAAGIDTSAYSVDGAMTMLEDALTKERRDSRPGIVNFASDVKEGASKAIDGIVNFFTGKKPEIENAANDAFTIKLDDKTQKNVKEAKDVVDATADGYVDQANARKEDVQDATEEVFLPSPDYFREQAKNTAAGMVSELKASFAAIDGWSYGNAAIEDYFQAFTGRYAENGVIKAEFEMAVDELLGAGATAAFNNGDMTPELFWYAWQNKMQELQPEVTENFNGVTENVFGDFKEAAERGAAGATDGLWSTFIDTTLANQGEAEEAVLSTFDYLWSAVNAEGNGELIASDWMYSIIGELDALESENEDQFVAIVTRMFGSVDAYEEAKGNGKDFMYGLVNGMSGEEGDTKDKLVGIIDRVLGYVKDSPEGFDENSPSKRAAGYGENFMKGFVQGVDGEEEGTKKSTVGVFDNIFGGIVASAAALALLNIAVSVSMNSMSDKMSTTLTTISSSFSTTWQAIGTTVTTAVNNIVYNVPRLFGEMGRNITEQGWWSVGDQIVAGIQSGVQDNWHWLSRTVWNLAISLYNTACNALGIHSPSKLFREGVGQMIGLGVAEGFEDTEPTIMNSVTDVADAMVDKMARTDMQFDVGTETALSSFSDKIADSFATLLDRLQAIADSVTFRTPAVAAGTVVPYNVAASVGGDSTGLVEALEVSNDDLASVIIQATNNAAVAIVDAIQRHGGINNPNVSAQTNAIIDEINRRTRANGASPILM